MRSILWMRGCYDQGVLEDMEEDIQEEEYMQKEKVFGEEGDYLKGMRRLVGEESVVMKEKLEQEEVFKEEDIL